MRDMFTRIESNRGVAGCYSNGTVGTQFGTGYAGTPTCTLGIAAQNAQAVADMTAWHALLLGSADTRSRNNIGAMIGSRGVTTPYDAVNSIVLLSYVAQSM